MKNQKRVLLIDDNESVLKSLQLYFESKQYHVDVVNNYPRLMTTISLTLKSQEYHDIVICDYDLGCHVNGIDVLDMIKDFYKNDPKLILMSGDYINYSQFKFLMKPFELENLEKAINN